MVIVKCQHSKIEFEAKTKRTKQHPLIASLKSDAHSDGNYSQVLVALDKVAKAGGYETIEEYLSLVDDLLVGKAKAEAEQENSSEQWYQEQEETQREAKTKREAQTLILKNNGYRWAKDYADFDEYEEGEPSVWNLYSPDRRVVTVEQALDEIERGADIVQTELATIIEAGEDGLPYDIILDGKLTEAKERRQQKETAAKDETNRLWKEAKDKIKDRMIEVEAFRYFGFETIFEQHIIPLIHRRIYSDKINGVNCAVIYRYLGGHDFLITEQYYSADPAAAGLAVTEHDRKKSFHKFFGE